jgi:hypothetical protein
LLIFSCSGSSGLDPSLVQPLQLSTTNSSWEQELSRLLDHSGAPNGFKSRVLFNLNNEEVLAAPASACMVVSLYYPFRFSFVGVWKMRGSGNIMEFVDKVSLKRGGFYYPFCHFQALALEFTSMLCSLSIFCTYCASK